MGMGLRPTLRSRALLLHFGTAGLFFHASAQALAAFKPRLGSHSVLRGCDNSERQRTTTGNPATAKMQNLPNRPYQPPPVATGLPPCCHPPKACWHLIHPPFPPARLVDSVDALGQGLGLALNDFLLVQILHTLKKERLTEIQKML